MICESHFNFLKSSEKQSKKSGYEIKCKQSKKNKYNL